MRRAPAVTLVVSFALWPTIAAAESAVPLRSYWDEAGGSIYTDVMLIHDDGRSEVVSELGGSVDGIGMVQIALYGQAPSRLAFVPTRNKSSARLRWANSWVFITPDSDGAPEVPGEGEMAALETALGTWNSAVEGCSYMRFVLKGREPLEVGLDGKNTVKFRGEKWCRPKRGDTPEKCYDPGATAITTLFFVDKASRPDNGVVLDADIELNSVHYAMAVGCEIRCQTDARTGIVEDLQNTLSHELGHVLGLDHTCWPFDSSTAPIDDDGNPAPSCRPESDLPDWVVEATMYNYQTPMEVKKRTPESDDVDGICSNYPTADDPKVFEEVDVSQSGGCLSVAGGQARGRGPAAWLAVLGILALLGGCTAKRYGTHLVPRAKAREARGAGLFTARACSRTRRR